MIFFLYTFFFIFEISDINCQREKWCKDEEYNFQIPSGNAIVNIACDTCRDIINIYIIF